MSKKDATVNALAIVVSIIMTLLYEQFVQDPRLASLDPRFRVSFAVITVGLLTTATMFALFKFSATDYFRIVFGEERHVCGFWAIQVAGDRERPCGICRIYMNGGELKYDGYALDTTKTHIGSHWESKFVVLESRNARHSLYFSAQGSIWRPDLPRDDVTNYGRIAFKNNPNGRQYRNASGEFLDINGLQPKMAEQHLTRLNRHDGEKEWARIEALPMQGAAPRPPTEAVGAATAIPPLPSPQPPATASAA